MNQFERWIVSKETLVLSEDLGDSLPAVDELLKNHTNIMNSLLAYEEQAKKLRAISQKLLESGDYNDEVIKTTIQTMNEKWAGLKASAHQKNFKLEQSKLLQQFLQDCNEVNAHRGTCHVFTHTHTLRFFVRQYFTRFQNYPTEPKITLVLNLSFMSRELLYI